MKLKSLSNKDRYGNMFSVEFFEPDSSIPIIMAIPEPTYDHPGDPKGTDTVPAWLTPGEFVMNAEATRKYEPELKKMNNEGREMQEKQGGSIPTYADDGGIIQSVTDFFTMPKPPEGSGIKYRRHKDGSIGMWAGNTFRGYYKEPAKKESSFSERLGISYNAEGGGVPPMYASVGDYVMPDFLSDEFLDKNVIPGMYATETSSGANVKTSEDGAIGPMQILPTTAASPGYDVQPRTLADIRSLEGAQQFAKDYMRGIHRYNPDFTLEEVVTAYHSGAGNVRKAKEGVEPLGPRGEAYADKVGVVDTEESTADKVFNIVSQLNPLGVTEAAAQSTLIPTNDAPPKDENDESFFSGLFDYFQNPPGVAKRRAANAEFNRKVAKNNAENVAKSFEEMESRRLRNIERGEDPFKGSEPVNEKTYNGLKKAVEFQKGEVIDNTEKSLVTNKVDPPIAAAVLEAEKKELETLGQPNIGDATDADAMDINTASVDAAKKVVDNTDKSKIPPSNQDKIIKETGENADPTFIEKAKQSFIDAFGDLFNPRELARMAIIYTGSRLLGYSHDGSLGYAAKQYISRIDGFAEDQFDAVKANKDAYTTKSYNDYLVSRDMDDLIPVSNALTITKTSGSTYIRGIGIVPKVTMSDKTERVLIQGKPVSISQVIDKNSGLTLADIMEPVDKEVHSVQSVRNRLDKVATDAMSAANRDVGLEDGKGLSDNSQAVAMEAASKFNKILLRNGASIAQAEDLEIVVNGAIQDYYTARAIAKKDGTTGPTSVEAYIEQRLITPLTNNNITSDMVKGTSAKNLRALNKRIYNGMNIKDKRNPEFQNEYANEWAATKKAWELIPVEERAEWTRKAGERKDYSAFTLWMSKTPDGEIDKIIEEAAK